MQFVVLILAILLLVSIKFLCKSIFTPSAINALMWGVFSIFSVFIYTSYPSMSYIGVLFLLIFAFTMILGERLGSKISIVEAERRLPRVKNVSKQKRVLVIFLILALFKEVLSVYLNGYSLSDFTNLDAFLKMNNEMAFNRYHGDSAYYNVFLQFLGCFTYMAPFCGGWLMHYRQNKKDLLLCFATFIPMAISVLMTNGKLGIIVSVALFAIGFILSYITKNKKTLPINKKFIMIIVVGAIGFVGVMFFVMMARTGKLDFEDFDVIIDKFGVYAFGHMEAFDVWFTNVFLNTEHQYLLGESTFSSIFSLFFGTERIQGVYESIDGAISNVFTAYRGVIEDFGLLGGGLFVFLIGFLGGILYRICQTNKESSALSITLMSVVYFWVVFSLFVSPWVYMTFLCIFPLIWVFLKAGDMGE